MTLKIFLIQLGQGPLEQITVENPIIFYDKPEHVTYEEYGWMWSQHYCIFNNIVVPV